MVKPIKAVLAIHDGDDYVEIEDETYYSHSIIPRNKAQIKRPIKVGRSAQVNGVVFGVKVEFLEGLSPERPTTAIGIYGEESVTIEKYCRIGGHVQSSGNIRISSGCLILGDIIGTGNISIKDRSVIYGNVISYYNINIGNDVEVGGYVISLRGSIAIGNNSKAFDIIANEDIHLGDNVVIKDAVIWTKKGSIDFSNIKIANDFEISPESILFVDKNEINPYHLASKTFNHANIIDNLNTSLLKLNNAYR